MQIEYLVAKKDLYISPSLYSKLQGKNKSVTYDGMKNDYHALGMTLLQLGVQDPVQNYYLDNGTVDKVKLQDHLNNFKSKYPNNPQLYESIVALTNPDDSLRKVNLNQVSPLVTAPLVVAPIPLLNAPLTTLENQVTHTGNLVAPVNQLGLSSEQFHHSPLDPLNNQNSKQHNLYSQ